MAPNLKNDARLWRLAADLGVKHDGDPVGAIVRFCQKKIRAYIQEHPCATPTELLQLAAIKLDTLFIEIDSDETLLRVRDEYCSRGELSFADLEHQLGPDVYAITFGLQRAGNGDRKFVSLIDCRGAKRFRSYFSKWHELAHLLTLTPQMRLRFCRTHVLPENKDPEEGLMDIVAGEFTFFPEMIAKYAIGPISFRRIEELRARLAPEASRQSAVIGLVKAWPRPCLLIRAELGLRKDQRLSQSQPGLGFAAPPQQLLRAVHANPNGAARAVGLVVPTNMRVPLESAINRVFSADHGSLDGNENLDWWESKGKHLPSQPVRVEAIIRGNGVDVLITPREAQL